jgi:hypothetical protein
MPINERADVISQFRDRIRNNVRRRLSKDDLVVLIEGFVDALPGAKSRKRIQTLCKAEIKLLEEGYPQPSVAKYLGQYRRRSRLTIFTCWRDSVSCLSASMAGRRCNRSSKSLRLWAYLLSMWSRLSLQRIGVCHSCHDRLTRSGR